MAKQQASNNTPAQEADSAGAEMLATQQVGNPPLRGQPRVVSVFFRDPAQICGTKFPYANASQYKLDMYEAGVMVSKEGYPTMTFVPMSNVAAVLYSKETL